MDISLAPFFRKVYLASGGFSTDQIRQQLETTGIRIGDETLGTVLADAGFELDASGTWRHDAVTAERERATIVKYLRSLDAAGRNLIDQCEGDSKPTALAISHLRDACRGARRFLRSED